MGYAGSMYVCICFFVASDWHFGTGANVGGVFADLGRQPPFPPPQGQGDQQSVGQWG